ncbi:MAG TPA: SAM-dependent methyltransferase [Chitinophagaceae bacterium]|jgi:16S rRNA (cytidine1402-2'-O)-methyltransferase|nr:SAM-dependent methyltransferase [Chitinophagaceae bacterium]
MATVYLIPSLLAEEGANALPPYIIDAIKSCHVFFAENERTTRRYFKQLWKEMIIDDYEWHTISGDSPHLFGQLLKQDKTIGIISEAGCPGVADPGQALIAVAQEMEAGIKPLVGPSSILLALMASGMNGQQFRFAGYLPIDNQERTKAIKDLETESAKKDCTQIFIETPYRNNQLIEALLRSCNASTRICIAVDITGKNEWIKTKTIAGWQKNKPDIHKRPAIFLLYAAV